MEDFCIDTSGFSDSLKDAVRSWLDHTSSNWREINHQIFFSRGKPTDVAHLRKSLRALAKRWDCGELPADVNWIYLAASAGESEPKELPMKAKKVKATPKEEEKSAPPLQGMRVIYESILPPWYAERARELYEHNIKAR